jgi:K+-transporting ATPase KdpF subunit
MQSLEGRPRMTLSLISLGIAVLLMIYLVYALLAPEKF